MQSDWTSAGSGQGSTAIDGMAEEEIHVVVDLLECSPWDLDDAGSDGRPDLRVVVLDHHERIGVLVHVHRALQRSGLRWRLDVWFPAGDTAVDRWVRRRRLQPSGRGVHGCSVETDRQSLAQW